MAIEENMFYECACILLLLSSTYYFWFIKSCTGIHADNMYRLCPSTLLMSVPVCYMMGSAVILCCGLLRFDTL